MICKKNKIISRVLPLVFQVIGIFAFLTLFFFFYVVNVERKEFQDQMKFAVDQILKNSGRDLIDNIIPKSNLTRQNKLVLVDGIIDTLEEQVRASTVDVKNSIESQNKKIRNGAFKILGITLAVLALLYIIIRFVGGWCVPLRRILRDTIVIVLVVGLTEIVFLQIIARKYISADPNRVKYQFAQTIQDWINQNHPREGGAN